MIARLKDKPVQTLFQGDQKQHDAIYGMTHLAEETSVPTNCNYLWMKSLKVDSGWELTAVQLSLTVIVSEERTKGTLFHMGKKTKR